MTSQYQDHIFDIITNDFMPNSDYPICREPVCYFKHDNYIWKYLNDVDYYNINYINKEGAVKTFNFEFEDELKELVPMIPKEFHQRERERLTMRYINNNKFRKHTDGNYDLFGLHLEEPCSFISMNSDLTDIWGFIRFPTYSDYVAEYMNRNGETRTVDFRLGYFYNIINRVEAY
jgi:hypothetical protein